VRSNFSLALLRYINQRHLTCTSVNLLERCVLDIGHGMSANRLKLSADKTELLVASASYGCVTLSGRYPALKLGADTVVACSYVCLLSVDISSYLSLDHHIYRDCEGGLLLPTLSTPTSLAVVRLLDSLATLVYAAVN